MLSEGTVLLGRYRVSEGIARGGSSVVYRAVDERLRRPVCVKVFTHESDDEDVRRFVYESFVAEAFALSRLTHPRTLRIYDFGYVEPAGSAGRTPFHITEYLDGGTLSERVHAVGPLSPSEVVDVVTGLAGALGEAHASGIVHRDVKPGNVLFSAGGGGRVAKLADFGIAARIAPGSTRSERATLGMYSLNWSAPEQFTGEAITASADTYSLALTTLFTLTGRVAMAATSRDVALERRRDVVRTIRQAAAGFELSHELLELLLAACRWCPDERPRDVVAFAAELAALLTGEVPSERPEDLIVGSDPLIVAGRALRFLDAPAELAAPGGAGRIRAEVIRCGQARWLSLRGVDCFLSVSGAPLTSAVQLSAPGAVGIVVPGRAAGVSADATLADVGAGETLISIGGKRFSVPATSPHAPTATIDFGPGGDCFVLCDPQPAR